MSDTKSVTDELHGAFEEDDTSEKLKKSRSNYAGWVTRTLKQADKVLESPHLSLIIPVRDRISGQLKKLQSAHDAYVNTLTEDEDINSAEDWMNQYLEEASNKLGELENRILLLSRSPKPHPVSPLATVDSSEVAVPGPSVSSMFPNDGGVTVNQGSSEEAIPGSSESSPPMSSSNAGTSMNQRAAVTGGMTDTPSSLNTSEPSTSSFSTSLNPGAAEFVTRMSMSPDVSSRPVDAWIDDLVPGMETPSFTSSNSSSDISQAVARLELDRDLPKVELPHFDGSAIMWPRFVEQFYIHVHSRCSLTDARRIEILQSHVTGEAKKLIQGLGFSGRNYAQCLQELKFAFGHKVAVARAYINSVIAGGTVPSGDASSLRAFYIAVRDCITTLQQMHYTGELNSGDVLQRASKRIPNDRRNKWNDFIRNVCRSREPTLMDLLKWLKDNVESEFCPYALSYRTQKNHDQHMQQNSKIQQQNARSPHYSTVNSTVTADNVATKDRTVTCSICCEAHHVSRCKDYMNKSPEDRYALVMSKQLCLNCLYPRHRVADCTSKNVCRSCSKKHHSTLHRKGPSKVAAHVNTQVKEIVNENVSDVVQTVYFQVVPVTVQGQNGRVINTYALLDSASDITLINSELARDLGLKGQKQDLVVDTMGPSFNFRSMCVSFFVKAGRDADASPLFVSKAWTRPGVFNCPSFMMSEKLQGLEHLHGLNLSDVGSHEVKLLIGANVPKAHLQLDAREGSCNEPIAIQTHLGWCVMGVQDSVASKSQRAHVNFLSSGNVGLDGLVSQVERFWQTESFGVKFDTAKSFSIQDQKALQVLDNRTKFENGHYEVPMLWKLEDVKLPHNRDMAEKRFQTLSKRVLRDKDFGTKYCDVMDGYIAKGFARKLSDDEVKVSTGKTWYLPHHSVLNPKKPNKVRVVFDAAASLHGVSLNNQLLSGPDLLNSLFGVLVRFRLRPVALVADIADMFYQVKVPPSDSEALRFLWKEDFSVMGPPDEYKMRVHIFGATDSPCCCNYALRRAALDHGNGEELAVYTILKNFYVDDMLTSVNDVRTAVSLYSTVQEMLQAKGFNLTKWLSSSKEVLKHIPSSSRAKPDLQLDFSNLHSERVLGIGWDVEKDAFVFRSMEKPVPLTKRGIIAAVSSVFDPLGLLAPFIFTAKHLIQELWRLNLDWDDVIPNDLQEVWKKWQGQLKNLANLFIPRHFGISVDAQSIELHIFSDASELGFASVAYLRIQLSLSRYACKLIAAKSHLAPVKKVLTIPKLELQGAVMSVRLAETLKKELDVKISRVIFWTDALTVLRYIKNDGKRWKIFVANRIAEIRESTEPEQWKFVPGTQNPADAATRGLPVQELHCDSTWFRGPQFLEMDDNNWPEIPNVGVVSEDDENLKRPVVMAMTTGPGSFDKSTLNVAKIVHQERYSSFLKLKRHTAWVMRAVNNFLSCISRFKLSPVKESGLSLEELELSERCLLRGAQIERYPGDFANLSVGRDISAESPIKCLDPFFDVDLQLIRVGGRLKNVPEGTVAQHQVLLPYDHQVSRLIIQAEHRKSAHCGPEQLISLVREKFWPVKCRLMAKKVINNCFDCRKRTSLPAIPFMADLPRERVTGFTPPFQFTGVDYFGPMVVKRGRSRIKRWGCLFSCLVTRAVHLELADSLETDDFILVLRCFISRRGKPQQLFSDNGTNFIGADRELQDCLKHLNQDKIGDYLAGSAIKWNFIPPNAPHFGGAWEILVKSVKRALKAVLKDTCVTESVLRTTLTEVENVVNSRPLTHNSSDPNDLSAITPNHFLHGVCSAVVPPDQCHENEICSRKRWRQSQVLSDHIWHRWLHEYLPSLNVRQKWNKENRNHVIGDIVLVIDSNRPRGQWSLGRVQEVMPSKDGKVRTVKVKTSQGIYVRPVAKICLLEESTL